MAESVFAALLRARPEAVQLLPRRFDDRDAWRAAAELAGERRTPHALIETLAGQSSALHPSPLRERHIDALARPGTSVVATGQQVGLFGGPLYSLHKAATAVARAQLVAELTGKPCVPLFWLQTEDHDYAEIASVDCALGAERKHFALPAEEPSAARVSVAHRTLPDEVEACLAELERALGDLPHAFEVSALLRMHYQPGRTLGQAFAGLIAELFAEVGLCVLDPRVPEVAALAAPLYARVLSEHELFARDLAERARAIAAAGCEEQVRTRPDATLVFFHPEGPTRARYRLVATRDGFETPLGALDRRALFEKLAREPLCFSSSALLRPLLQDRILPTCAYVGGPAELSYFAQLPPLYARLGIPMPLIAPRARLRVLEPSVSRLLEQLGLRADELEQPREALLARVTACEPNASRELVRARLLDPLERELDALAKQGFAGLAEPLKRTREACANAIGKLAEKTERAARERDRIACDRLERAQLALAPDGVPQERAYGFFAIAAKVGVRQLVSAILERARSLEVAVGDVKL